MLERKKWYILQVREFFDKQKPRADVNPPTKWGKRLGV